MQCIFCNIHKKEEDIIRTVNDIKFIVAPHDSTDSKMFAAFKHACNANILLYRCEVELENHVRWLEHNGIGSKDVVILKKFLGRFVQKCPGSLRVICCNYRVINTCFNCLYDCSYCFLRGYLNTFGIVQFLNVEDLMTEVENFFQSSSPHMVYRIGTGEFTDSLMFDSVTKLGEELIVRASKYPNIMIELKTKSSNVDHLLSISQKGNAVLSWSIASEINIARYERGTATLQQRLRAMQKAVSANYYVAVHFDPIILYNGWENDYKRLVKMLFEHVDATKIVWISLGGFRYAPGFKDVLKNLESDEEMTLQEMFPGIDGKFRYFKPIRIAMYKFLLDHIRAFTSQPFIYLCMESSDVWNQVMGKNYATSEELEKDFSEAMMKFVKRTR